MCTSRLIDRQVQRRLQHDERGHGDRQADEEAPRQPSGRVDDQAADERAADRGEGERRRRCSRSSGRAHAG